MRGRLALAQLRVDLGETWILVLSGLAYAISQATILVIVRPLGSSLLRLQCLGFSAEETLHVFRHWQETGVLAAYQAHFLLDDPHWVWYALFFTSVLCRLFELRGIAHRHDWILLLPLASGLLDAFENRLQHLFLSVPDFSRVVDPLPLLSAVASNLKWALALGYAGVALVLLASPRRRARSPVG
jgi:hypothetical protein